MWSGKVTQSDIYAAGRWNVSYFAMDRIPDASSVFEVVELGDVVRERRGSVDPQTGGDSPICYLGLENVRSLTGELVDFSRRASKSIKSRSKIFLPNDILYGRLRPELNKVFLAEGEAAEGICSGEFIVLFVDTKVANARFVRHMLASPHVSEVVHRFRAGASLPRIAAKDLLSIKVPLPPLELQNELALQLEQADQHLSGLRRRLEAQPTEVQAALMRVIELGVLNDPIFVRSNL